MSVGLDPRVGSELAGYRIESVIGRGGMGVVYLAQDLRLKRRVALKLISPELAAGPRFRERFLRESELAAALDHSHVVPVHAAGETDGQLWIAMRYVEGEDLATLLEREGPLEPARALDLCSQVGKALDVAHGRGLVHRDVKPANVLVTEEGGKEHCYLTDFGLARGATDAGPAGESPHLSGTVDYSAPEQIAHEPLDHRSDLYSLACVFYECLVGAPPFQRPRAMATLFAHANEAPPSLHELRPELPEPIDPVIAKALAKNPDERYDTCHELIEAARDALGLEARSRFTRRRLLLIAAAAAALVAAATAVPAILLGSGDPPGPKVALPVTENTLLRIDPQTGEPIAAVQLGEDPTHLAAGEGSLWIVDSRERSLLRVDPQRDAVIDTIDISRIGLVAVVRAGAGAVWLNEVNPLTTDDIWRYVPDVRTLAEFAERWLVGIDEDGVWVVGPGTQLARLDPSTGETLESVRFEPWSVSSAVVGEGFVWGWNTAFDTAANVERGTVEVADLRTGVLKPVDTGVAIDELAIGQGAAWVLGNGGVLVRIDPETVRAEQPIRVGRSADSIAVGEGFVWVGSSRDGIVTRVDPETSDLLTVDVGGRPEGIAVAEGGVWVIVRPA